MREKILRDKETDLNQVSKAKLFLDVGHSVQKCLFQFAYIVV